MAAGRKANLLVGAVLLVAVIAALMMLISPAGKPGRASDYRALVHDGDGGVRELPLDQDTEIAISTSYGTNLVVVSDGSVFVRDADCDNLDCVRQGAIAQPGRQIICLPHRLWIEIVASGASGGDTWDTALVAGGSDDFDAVAR